MSDRTKHRELYSHRFFPVIKLAHKYGVPQPSKLVKANLSLLVDEKGDGEYVHHKYQEIQRQLKAMQQLIDDGVLERFERDVRIIMDRRSSVEHKMTAKAKKVDNGAWDVEKWGWKDFTNSHPVIDSDLASTSMKKVVTQHRHSQRKEVQENTHKR